MAERESGVRWSDRPRFGLGAGALILDPDDRLLLDEQERFGERVWTVPGGGLELGETVEECARREVLEEVGLRVTASVVIAKRLESAADASGILVSDVVRQAVAGKDFEFEDRGELELKGFDEPARAWAVGWEG